MKFISTLAARKTVFDHLEAYYGKGNVQPIELRLERTLKNNISEYVFPVVLGDAPLLECENRLNVNDLVVVTDIAYGLYERDRTLADASVKTLETYANVNAFTSGGATFNWKHLRRAWMGAGLSIRRGTELSLERHPMSLHYEASVTQQASATTNSSGAAESAGRRQIMPRLKLRGGEQIEIKISYAPFATVKWEQDAPNVDVQAALLLGGFVIKGNDGKKEISL